MTKILPWLLVGGTILLILNRNNSQAAQPINNFEPIYGGGPYVPDAIGTYGSQDMDFGYNDTFNMPQFNPLLTY